MKTSRNIGGSLLPSSNARILTPMETKFGILVVRPLPDKDTHILILAKDSGSVEICDHPNGFSCHVLAERMIKGDAERIDNQARYIIACGGKSLSGDKIMALISTSASA